MNQKKFSISVKINGYSYTLQTVKLFTILDLIHFLKYEPNLVLVEYQGIVCPKNYWTKFYIENNSQIEFLTIVGGG
jgi:thiamine biosynthesis protein ThiS